MQPLITPPAGAAPLDKNQNFTSVWYLYLQALQQHVSTIEGEAGNPTGSDAVYAITNGTSAPALAGAGTITSPFLLTAETQLLGIIATTQDVYLQLPAEASMLGLRAIACLSPANTNNVWLVTRSGDTLDGSAAAYQITVPSITVEGGDSNDYRITATVAGSAIPTPDAEAPHAVTVTELPASRAIDLGDQSTSTTLKIVVQEAITPSGSFVVGTQLHLQLSSDGGANWYDAGQTIYDSDRNPAHEDGTHTYYQTTIDVPGVPVFGFAQTFQARAWAITSAIDGGPATATASVTGCTLTLDPPLATGIAATITNVAGLAPTQANIYMGPNGLNNPYCQVNLTVTTPGQGDPNLWYYWGWVEWTDASGTPINPGGVANTSGWNPGVQFPNDGTTQPWNLQINYPGPGIDGYLKIEFWGFNRAATAVSAPFAGDVNSVLQTSWGTAGVYLLHVGPPPGAVIEAPSTVTLTELGASRKIRLSDQTTSTTLRIVIQEAITPPVAVLLGTQLHLQLSSDNGSTWYDAGQTIYDSDRNPADEDGTHTYYQTTIDVTGVPIWEYAQTFQARAWALTAWADPGPAALTASVTGCTLTLDPPLATGIAATITNVAGLAPTQANIYMGPNGLNNPYCQVNLTVTTPGQGDPNLWYYWGWVEWTDASGTPINPGGVANTSGWNPGVQFPNDGTTQPWNLQINYPGPGIDGYLKIEFWGFNRAATAVSAPFAGDVNSVLQTSWGTAGVYLLHVGSPPTLTVSYAATTNAQLALAYSGNVSVTGGTGPYTYQLISGALPAGLTLNAATGAVTGTPTTVGSSSFTVAVTDSLGGYGSVSTTIAVTDAAPTDTPVASITGGDASALLTTDPKYYPRYADNNTGSVKFPLWYIPVLTAPVYPQIVALFLDTGDGLGWRWQQNVVMNSTGQVIYVNDDLFAPTAAAATFQIACSAGLYAGDAQTGITLPVTACTPYSFTVNAVGTCPSNDITNAQFMLDSLGSQIEYTYTGTGQLVWIPHLLQWTQPSSAQDVNYWYSFVTWQKGHVSGGTWVPASDKEGQNEDPTGAYPGIYWIASNDLTGGQTLPGATIQVPGNTNSEWTFPPNLMPDGITPNPDRTYRFWIIAASRLGTTITGGAGTFTLQTVCWPSGADHYDLTPDAHPATVDASTLAPNTLGPGLGPDGSGRPQVKVGGPNYIDITNSVNIRVSSDYLVTTGPTPTLTQNAVNFAKAYNFGSEFTVTGGVFVVNAIAVNKLLAGSALFSGSATFAYSGGGIVTINSLGIAIADNNTTPLNTVTVTASGVIMQGIGPAWSNTTAYGTGQVVSYAGASYLAILAGTGHQPNISPTYWQAVLPSQLGISATGGIQILGMGSSLAINSGGLQIFNGTSSVYVQATGIVISNGSSSVTVAPGGVTIVNGVLSSPVISGGTITSPSINGCTITLTSGTTTINIDASNIIKVSNSSTGYSSFITPGFFSGGSGPSAFQLGITGLALMPGTGIAIGTSTGYTGTLAAAISAGKSVVGGIIVN
jgi:hypothetical protein